MTTPGRPGQPRPNPTRGRRGLRRASLAATGLLLGTVALAACSTTETGSATGSTTPGTPLKVVTAFYPLAFAAEQVGGDQVAVTNLTPPGVEPHDLELTPAQVAQIRDADLVVYVPGFQAAVDEAISQQAADKAVDATTGLTLLPAEAGHEGETTSAATPSGTTDPHVWLNPANMAAIGANVSAALSKDDPAQAAAFQKGATNLATQMSALTADYTEGLKSCKISDMVVSHEAFAYLAQAFGLTQVGIAGLSPDAEPSPARLKEVSDIVKANGVTTIYYETLVDPKVAQTLAAETGATAAVLDPLEGLAEGSNGNYETIMRQNLVTLQKGQSCQ